MRWQGRVGPQGLAVGLAAAIGTAPALAHGGDPTTPEHEMPYERETPYERELAPTPEPDAASEAASPADGTFEWGYAPASWKWGLLAGSGVILVGGAVMAFGFGVPAARAQDRQGRLHDDLVEAAIHSLVDDSDELAGGSLPGFNDVDIALVREPCSSEPGSGGALEVLAIASDGREAVRNAEVAEQCRRIERSRRIGIAGWSFLAVGLVATAVSTTLLFVRRPPRRHRVDLGFGAGPRGATATAVFRF